MIKEHRQKTWVEVRAKALQNNAAQFRSLVDPSVQLMAVVKSNAYGHGLKEAAHAVRRSVDWFGVDSLDEALTLRRARITQPTLILGYTRRARLHEAARHRVRFTVYDRETVRALNRSTKKERSIPMHVKLETGTHRQGVLEKDLISFFRFVKRHPSVFVEGLSMHFANIEDTTSHTYAEKQLRTFLRMTKRVESIIGPVPIKHMACSAATILFPETHGALARVGIGMYGLWPSKETKVSASTGRRSALTLQPALTWKTIVAQVKTIPRGSAIGYGCTETVQKTSTIAILPIGYWDGYDRKLSSVGNVLIRGKRCKVIGRICMNMCMVDVSHLRGLRPEEEVVLLGKQGREEITAEELAQKIGTIHYEVVTRINSMIPRIVV